MYCFHYIPAFLFLLTPPYGCVSLLTQIVDLTLLRVTLNPCQPQVKVWLKVCFKSAQYNRRWSDRSPLCPGRDQSEPSSARLSLATFLISRACSNCVLANFLYWYLLIECEDAEGQDAAARNMYLAVMKTFSHHLVKGERYFLQGCECPSACDVTGLRSQIR